MIQDSLERLRDYQFVHPDIVQASVFIQRTRRESLPVGRYEIGPNTYALIQEYESRPAEECKWEAHRGHADIQVVLSGEEIIDWAPEGLYRGSGDYSEERDIRFFGSSGEGLAVSRLNAGSFAAYLPAELHRPCCMWGARCPVRKVVVKLRMGVAGTNLRHGNLKRWDWEGVV